MNNRLLLALISILMATACTHVKKLSGNYQGSAYSIKTNKSYDQAWSALIDIFASNNIAITTADKSNGLILSTPYSFLDTKKYTYESDGKIQKPSAWVVIPKIHALDPKSIKGQFNIRIKKQGEGSDISVSIANIEALSDKPRSKWERYDAASTGVFEKMIADQIN